MYKRHTSTFFFFHAGFCREREIYSDRNEACGELSLAIPVAVTVNFKTCHCFLLSLELKPGSLAFSFKMWTTSSVYRTLYCIFMYYGLLMQIIYTLCAYSELYITYPDDKLIA